MMCPKCEGRTKVNESRHNQSGQVRRRRSCLDCGHLFTTYEVIQGDEVQADSIGLEPVKTALLEICARIDAATQGKESLTPRQAGILVELTSEKWVTPPFGEELAWQGMVQRLRGKGYTIIRRNGKYKLEAAA